MMTKFAGESNRAATRKKSILVGTVDYKVEEVLARKLDALQYDVNFVRKGSEVILNILEYDVDLVILDMDISGPLGFDILVIIRKSRPRLPVIVISADYTYQLRKTVAEVGISYQMQKPVEPDEMSLVSQTVQNLLVKNDYNVN